MTIQRQVCMAQREVASRVSVDKGRLTVYLVRDRAPCHSGEHPAFVLWGKL